ncbi:DUF3736 domain-containing protein [Trichonephila clavata]|uniref:DUF3736 domain-containing protein n=1 Tax=Trichonephila clavata TaxID=2740835 RepID=A0A8X6KAT1_TRICU|nr:DUF3736 domain-containing protein [Trichonephila clavata]
MALNNLFAAKDNFVPRPFGYFEYLALQGIPHGLKPPSSHLSVPAPYGVSKSAVRNVMSPVHQSGSHPSTGFSPFTNSINPALNATRTSSFAAALRKLAKQAVDPIAEKDLSPISPASTPSSSQQSIHSRHHAPVPMYMNSHNPNPPGHGSPSPSVTPSQSSQGKALDLGRYSSTHRNGSIVEPVSLKIESSKLISSSNDKRNDISSGNKHLGPLNMPPSLRQDHNLSRGFQPYRNSDERRSTPPQVYNPSPPPNTMSGYAYHPSMLQSSRMQPQSYSRLDESVYMERYGLLRPSTMPYPPPTNMIPHPRTPIYPSNQYPPELIPQSMRSVPSNNSYSSNRYNHEEESVKENNMIRKREMEIYREHERYMERDEGDSREREIEYMRKERNLMRQSPLTSHHSSSRLESSNEEKGLMGSITHGTPRDYARSLSPPTSTSTTPLNLATSVAHMENHLPPHPLKEEYNSRLSRQGSSTINGQLHPRSTNHISTTNYRKENDSSSSYRMHYHIMESEKKPTVQMETQETGIPVSSHAKPSSYYMERDNQKSNTVETRTLSLGSVINSQINGIFARDNILCNNNLLSLNPETNQWEYSVKHESENKKTFPAQESYNMIPSKVPSNEKSHESLHSDSSSNKTPSYMLSEHSYMYQGDSNGYPPTFKAKEPTLPRVLKNLEVASYEHEVQSFSEPVERVASVLDAREAKLRKLRKDAVIDESDESGIDSDEEDPEKLKQFLTITKGPPIKIESDPKKSAFLSFFGLVTDSKRQALELKKCLRRHKALRERSLSPVEDTPVKGEYIEYDQSHLAELSNRLCFSEDIVSKTEFLRTLGLVFLTPEQKEEKDIVRNIIQDEKLRRYGLLPHSQRCLDLQGSHLRKRGYSILNNLKHGVSKKPNLSRDESLQKFVSSDRINTDKNELSLRDAKPVVASVQRLSSFLKPPMRTVPIPVPPLIPTCQVISQASEAAQNKNSSVVAAKDPRVRQVNKDFVQEFHNSVLQTTQMQLAEKKNISPAVSVESSFQRSPLNTISDKSDWLAFEYRPPFRWPGIEAIMESYECHISEQSMEKKFLIESCQKLKAFNEKSNLEVECLQKKTEELMKEKHILDCKRQDLQNSFEKLKLFIQHFR